MKNSTQLEFSPQLRQELIFKPSHIKHRKIALPAFHRGLMLIFACVCTGKCRFHVIVRDSRRLKWTMSTLGREKNPRGQTQRIGGGDFCEEGWLRRNAATPIRCCFDRSVIDGDVSTYIWVFADLVNCPQANGRIFTA